MALSAMAVQNLLLFSQELIRNKTLSQGLEDFADPWCTFNHGKNQVSHDEADPDD